MSYTISLVNDLHNYFPEILYGTPNRFPTVQSLLDYIRHEVRVHHDLFSNSQQNYITTHAPPVPPQNDNVRFTFNFEESPRISQNEEMNGRPLTDIMNLLQYVMQPPPPNFMESVIVRPSLQQIAANSTIVDVASINGVCAICQENMDNTEQIRRINRCQHMFHDDCIGTWFQQNVHCPTCRHDIRV